MATTSVFVEVVRVTSRKRQQDVLRLVRGVVGLTAFDVSSGNHHLVIFWCADKVAKSAAELLLADIDHDAVCTYLTAPGASRSRMTARRVA